MFSVYTWRERERGREREICLTDKTKWVPWKPVCFLKTHSVHISVYSNTWTVNWTEMSIKKSVFKLAIFGVLMRFVWRSLGVGMGVLGEWFLDILHSSYANTHYKHEYSVHNSIWPKGGLSDFGKNSSWSTFWLVTSIPGTWSDSDLCSLLYILCAPYVLMRMCYRTKSSLNNVVVNGHMLLLWAWSKISPCTYKFMNKMCHLIYTFLTKSQSTQNSDKKIVIFHAFLKVNST